MTTILLHKLEKAGAHYYLDAQEALNLYVLECILYRFSLIQSEKTIVRGSLMTRAWVSPTFFRKAQDIDFMLDMKFDELKAIELIESIIQVKTEDGLHIMPTYDREIIWKETESPAVRINLTVQLEDSKFIVQIDIAFNDPLEPPKINYAYQNLLGFSFTLPTISPELAIAWKVHGLFEFWEKGFRWQSKTLYDIYALLHTQHVNSSILEKAIQVAFEDRKTPIEVYQRMLTGKFGASKGSIRAWQKWILQHEGKIPNLRLEEVIISIRKQLDKLFLNLINQAF